MSAVKYDALNTMNIVIIGGEAAGMSAAAKARRAAKQARIVVFEQSDVISFGACGLPYYVGGFFSEAKEMTEFSVEQFAERGVDVRIKHRVTHIDVEQKVVQVTNLLTGEAITQPYDQLLIATGAQPIIPPVSGLTESLNAGRTFCVKTLKDGLQLREVVSKPDTKTVAVIGAGYIGLEMVEALKRQGKDIRLIDSADQPLLGTFDREVAQWVMDTLKTEDVQCHWQEQAVEQADRGLVIRTNKGQYAADLIILCTGIKPNTQIAEHLNLEQLPNGAIVTDAQGRTGIADIFAAGDCATVMHGQLNRPVWIPLATYANKMGRLIGEVMAGSDKQFLGAYGAACVKVLNLEAGRVGLSEKEAIAAGLNYKTVVIKDKNHTNYYPGQSDLMVKLVYEADSKKILGGQMVGGQGAVLRLDALVVTIKSGVTTEELGMMDFCYAPPFARTWDALNVAGNVAK